ncbi:MAG: hypothetical protein RII27_04100, partial [Alphaproteobacteria bacterium]
ANHWQRATRRGLAPLGLTQTQALQLTAALDLPAGFSQIALARASGVDVTVVSPATRGLVTAGYLQRGRGPDERTRAVQLTARGRSAARAARQVLHHTDATFFARFTDDHQALRMVLSTLSGRPVRVRAAAGRPA